VSLTSLADLSAAVRELACADDIERALQLATDAAVSILRAEHASIRLCTAEDLRAVARSGAGLDDEPPAFRPGEGVMGWVAATGRSARIRDAHDDPRFRVVERRGFSPRSVLSVPILSTDRVLGVFSMSTPEPDAFAADHEHAAFVLGQCAGQALRAAELSRLATIDSLTHAYNRGFLMPSIVREMNRAQREGTTFSVLLMDLDRFKAVNDRFGHAVGDGVLRRFADVVRASVRSVDVLIRRGGEEFVLVMPGTTEEEAIAVAERIREHFESHPSRLGPGDITNTVSIGLAAWNGRETADELDERADQAMYEAKRAGRNCTAVARLPGLWS
jgi:diguanylate cyclase (GGDEF)-like protein